MLFMERIGAAKVCLNRFLVATGSLRRRSGQVNPWQRCRFLLPLLALCLMSAGSGRSPFEIVIQRGQWLNGTNNVIFSPDGRYIFSAADKDIRIWQVSSGKVVKILRWHTGSIETLAISKKGRLLASGARDKQLCIWDTQTLIKLNCFEAHKYSISRLDFSPDGATIVSAGGRAIGHLDGDRQIKHWETRTGRRLWTNDAHTDAVHSVAFSPDGTEILSTGGSDYSSKSSDNTVRVWAASTGKMRIMLKGHSDTVTSAKFSPSGKFIMSTSWDKLIKIWDSASGTIIKTLEGHQAPISNADFSPDGHHILSAAGTNSVCLWNISSGKLAKTYSIDGKVSGVNFSPDGKTAAIIAEDGSITILHIESGQKLQSLVGYTRSILSLATAKNLDFLVLGTDDGRLAFWSLLHGKLIRASVSSENSEAQWQINLAVSPNGNLVATGSRDSKVRIFDTSTTKIVQSIELKSAIARPIFFKDGKRLAIASGTDLTIWDLNARKILKENRVHFAPISSVALLSDDKSFILACEDGTLVIWDNEADLPLGTIQAHNSPIMSTGVSPDGKTIVTGSEDMTLKIWNRDLTKNPVTLRGHSGAISKVNISEDGSKIISGSYDNTVRIWEISSGKLIKTLQGHESSVTGIAIHNSPDSFLSASLDTSVRIWNGSEHKLGMSFMIGGSAGDWLTYTPDGYWDASPNGGRLVAMVKGLEGYGVDQFAIRNNRPDIILQRLGSKDQARIEHFHDLYQARLKKFGISEADLSGELHAPEAKIVETKTAGKFAEVKFSLNDSKYDLHSYNVFVNDVPLLASGKKISGKTGTISEKIELTSGENKIEISVLNSKYVESIRALTLASYQPKEPVKGDLYFIGFGVSKYQNSKFDLKYAASDADNMEKTLLKMKGKGYREVHAHVFKDKDVTPEKIRAAKKLLANAKPDDTFVLFISGHGKHDTDKGATYYYLTHNADLNNLAGTAAKFELIEDLLHGIGPRQKIFLMDTCESGETDEGTSQKYLAWAAARKAKGVHARAIPSAKGLATSEGAKPVRSYLHERDRFIYNDLMRRSGAIVFSSSRGGEFSYEDDALKSGYFTKAILDGLAGAADENKDGKVAIDELKQYTSKTVQKWSDGLQNPTVDRDNIYQKIVLPVVR